MVKTKKSPKEAKSFDEFLETLDLDSGDDEGENEHVRAGFAATQSLDSDEESEDDSESEISTEELEKENGDDSGNLETESEVELELNEEENSETALGTEANSEQEEEEGSINDEDIPEISLGNHKKALQNLQETDPDFFAYLRENDAELLNFDDSADEADSENEDAIHKPPEQLEDASDSEAEEELVDENSIEHKTKVSKFLKKRIVNLHVIAEWGTKLSTTKDLGVLTNVVDSFECAVQVVLQGVNPDSLKWRVDGSTNFNALIRLCIKELKGFCVRFLCGNNNVLLSENKFDQRPFEVMEKSKQKWVRLRSKIKSYMKTLVLFMKSMGNAEAIAAVLRHCQEMSGFWALTATKSYKLLKTLINIWSQGEDSCRVLAFLAIIRMTNYNKDIYLTRALKQMYMSYVANCKFTSINTWPAINFMRSSLVEIYLLDASMAYSVAFPFIRQLAIHLRNAVTAGTSQQVKQSKKETSRIVYSWQFVHSLHVWVDLLANAAANGNDSLKLLVYPVVQVSLGTIKLIPTKKYIPLRFHIVKMLIKLQDKTKISIPILPLATEVLHLTDFSSKSASKFSVRPLDLTCCLKSEVAESGYAKAVSESAFDSVLGACKAIATELSFPEIVTPTLIQLKSFLKKGCKNAEVAKKFKTLIEKIEANSKYIKAKRSKALEDGQVSLSDPKSQQILRIQMEVNRPHPPLLAFATEYFKANAKVTAKLHKKHLETREEKLIPKHSALKRKKKVVVEDDSDEFDGLMFASKSQTGNNSDGSDSEFKTKFDEDNEEKQNGKKKRKKTENSELKTKTKKKKAKIVKEDDTLDVQDELIDFELSD